MKDFFEAKRSCYEVVFPKYNMEGKIRDKKKTLTKQVRVFASYLKLLELLDKRSLFCDHDRNVQISQRRQLLQKVYRRLHGQRFHLGKSLYRVDGKGLNHQIQIVRLHA